MSISERKKEIKRRRHRLKKLNKFEKQLPKANGGEKALMAQKLRQLTPGAEVIIEKWQLEAN